MDLRAPICHHGLRPINATTTKEVPPMKIVAFADLGAAPACGVAGPGTA
jgi:hypothetical protein